MARKTLKDNAWRDVHGGSAFIIPVSALRHQNFRRLSEWGCKLIFDLSRQYTGFNNGHLCASWSVMKNYGWGSPVTLGKAVKECEHYRLLIRTRQGGLNKASLHAFTWWRVHEINGKHLDVSSTVAPSNDWLKDDIPDFDWANPPVKKRSSRRIKPMLKLVVNQ